MSDFPKVLNYSNLCFAGSQQQIDNLLDDPRFVSLLQQLVEKCLPFVVVPMLKRFMEESFLGTLAPMLDTSVRKVVSVKEQLDRALQRLNAKANWMPRDEPGTSEPRHLTLKFKDRVHVPVFTGKEIKGENGNSIRVALVDADGNLINSGSEASSEVEIMVRLDGVDDSESSSACGESGSCTKLTEKKLGRPLLSKTCLKLKEGIAVLDNMKFRHKAQWTKGWQVRLVARFIGNVKGTTVKDAETEAFLVTDWRSTLYEKRHPPLFHDELWRLTGISKQGKRHQLLQKEKINCVGEFLRAYYLNPQSLQERLGINAEKFKAMVEHAKECEIPRGLHIYYPSPRENAAVVFDDVECGRGLVHNDVGVVPAVELNDNDQVVSAPPLSAFFVTRCCNNEASTSDFPAQTPNDANTSISPMLASPSGFITGPNKTIDSYDFDDLPPLMSPSRYDINDFCSIDLGSLSPGMDCCCCDNFQCPNHDAILESANHPCIESHNNQNTGAAVCKGSSAHVHSSGKAKRRWEMVVTVVMFVRKSSVSVRKRIVAPEDTHAQKRQRHC